MQKLKTSVATKMTIAALAAVSFQVGFSRAQEIVSEPSSKAQPAFDQTDELEQPRQTLEVPVQEPTSHTRFRWSNDLPGKSPYQRSHYTVLRTFKSAMGDHWRSTVRLLDGDHQLALGVIVDENGWVLSKSSELPDTELTCRLADASRVNAHVMLRRADLDLALVKLDKTKLPAIHWDEHNSVMVGGFLASTDSQSQPLAIGVVSVKPRSIQASPPVLGIHLENSDGKVVAVNVIEGGGAARAGILNDDVLVAINGQKARDVNMIKSLISANRSGDRVKITIEREGETQEIVAQLTDLSIALSDPTEAEVNGQISARATDFVSVFQHDTVLTPNQCGGPLVNLHGQVVGLNIARAGRVHCYAIPMDVLVPAVDDMLKSVSLALKTQSDGNHVLVDSRVSDQLPHQDRSQNALKGVR